MTKQEVIKFLIPEANIVNSLCKNKQSVFMGQVIQESGWLEHCPGNNALGIKWVEKSDIGKPFTENKTWEWSPKLNKFVEVIARFRAYSTLHDCFMDYVKLMNWSHYLPVAQATDFVEQTIQLRYCGYATSPAYTNSIQKCIIENKLYQYDWKKNPQDTISEKTPNFIWKESYSNSFVLGVKYYNIIEPPEVSFDNVIRLAETIQPFRTEMGVKFGISNWYRTKRYNSDPSIGGVADSQHTVPDVTAADIKPAGGVSSRVKLFQLANKNPLIHGIGVGSDWLHLDIRKEYKRIWYY